MPKLEKCNWYRPHTKQTPVTPDIPRPTGLGNDKSVALALNTELSQDQSKEAPVNTMGYPLVIQRSDVENGLV